MTTQVPPPPPTTAPATGEVPAAVPRTRPDVGRLDGTTAAMGLITAVVAQLSLQAHVSNLAAPIATGLASYVLWRVGGLRTLAPQTLAGGAIVVALWLPVRASAWLVTLNSLTAAALLAGAVLIDTPMVPQLSARYAHRLTIWLATARFGPGLLIRSAQPQASSQRVLLPVLRGLALAALPILVLGSILASADAVFANAFAPSWSADSVFAHLSLTTFFILVLAGAICIRRCRPVDDLGEPPRPIGIIEATVVLAMVAVLFAAFAIVQLIGALGGLDHVLQQEGLTRAEYAREGFFQLLIVAALTFALVATLSALTARETGRLASANRLAGALVSALTVVIVAVSVLRLRLYVDAFGQTMLRWYSTAFAVLLGVLFVLLAVQILAARRSRFWFGWAAGAVIVVTLLGVNVVNPEARVAEHNLNRPITEADLDVNYLLQLSADAWPVLLEHPQFDTYAPAMRARCPERAEPLGYGPFGFNLARSRLNCTS